MKMITVGRKPDCDVVVTNDQTVSKLHLQLVLDDNNCVWLTDLSSKHQTTINGNRVDTLQPIQLHEFDIVKIGYTLIDWNYFLSPNYIKPQPEIISPPNHGESNISIKGLQKEEFFESSKEEEASEIETTRYAGFWIRTIAHFIDNVIVNITIFLLSISELYFRLGALIDLIFVLVISLIIPWFYFATMESSKKQATLGKQLVGIKVTNNNADKITFANATGRFFAKIISSIILGLGFFMAGWNPKKLALHDIIADTMVIYRK